MLARNVQEKLRRALIKIGIIFIVILSIEVGVRLLLHIVRGSATVGMIERMHYLNYQPFVMFGAEYDKELDPARFPKEPGTYRILLLGPSTARAFPRRLLEEAFQRKFPNYRFEVINAAGAGYSARQEFIIASLWGTALKPNMIITLDGANDLTHRLMAKKAGTFYLNEDYELALQRPFLSAFAHLLRHSQLANAITRFKARLEIDTIDKYVDAIPVYISAQQGITVLARGMSAMHLVVLQPFMALKEPLSKAEASFTHYKYRESVVKELYKRLHGELTALADKGDIIYINGWSAFNGIEKTIFADDVHFVSDEGYRILADRIISFVSEEDLKATSSK